MSKTHECMLLRKTIVVVFIEVTPDISQCLLELNTDFR